MLKRLVRIVTLALVLPLAVGTLYASAQGLPQTSNATAKAGQGGMTAGASLEREGGSALEPYLITWLLPAFGLITFGVCIWADKRMRQAHHRA
jgi:hypothetical protein